jgi:hypothetical protein
MLATFIVLVIAFSGIFIGQLLARIAREEIQPGKRYFLVSRKIILGMLIALLLISITSFSFLWMIAVLFGAGLGYAFRSQFFFFGLTLMMTSLISPTLFFICAVLVFLHLMIFGSVEKKISVRIPAHALLFFIPLVLFFFPSFLLTFQTILFGILAGALLFQS